nr:hypothetical protein [Tanacetum cinerariifolium]
MFPSLETSILSVVSLFIMMIFIRSKWISMQTCFDPLSNLPIMPPVRSSVTCLTPCGHTLSAGLRIFNFQVSVIFFRVNRCISIRRQTWISDRIASLNGITVFDYPLDCHACTRIEDSSDCTFVKELLKEQCILQVVLSSRFSCSFCDLVSFHGGCCDDTFLIMILERHPTYTHTDMSFDHAIDIATLVKHMPKRRLGPNPITFAIINEQYVSARKPDKVEDYDTEDYDEAQDDGM